MNTAIQNRNYSQDSIYRTADDFRIVNALLANPRYKIPEQLRGQMVQQAANIMGDLTGDSSISDKLQAMKMLVEMDKQNIAITKLAMPKRVEHSFEPQKMTTEELKDSLRDAIDRGLIDVKPVEKHLPKPEIDRSTTSSGASDIQ